MAKRISQLAPTNVSDTSFRAWINEIHNSLIAFGWTQTADTGQINFSTVTRPTAVNTFQGFAIYQMGDALQSSCAVFMRWDFGTGNNTDTPVIKFQVGVGGTNGSGTLTGSVSSTFSGATQGQGTSATLSSCRTSGTTSAFRMMFWSRTAGCSTFICIERDKDSSGADTANGVSFVGLWCFNNGGATTLFSQFLSSGSAGLADTTRLYGLLSAQISQTWHSQTGVAPLRTSLGPFRNPMTGFLLTQRNDFAESSVNPVTIYGTSHNYIMGALGTVVTIQLNGITPDCGIAMLWE